MMSLFLFFMHKDLSQHLCQAKNINLYGIVNQLIFQKVSQPGDEKFYLMCIYLIEIGPETDGMLSNRVLLSLLYNPGYCLRPNIYQNFEIFIVILFLYSQRGTSELCCELSYIINGKSILYFIDIVKKNNDYVYISACIIYLVVPQLTFQRVKKFPEPRYFQFYHKCLFL